jgi:hypothetical protein
MGEYLGGGWQSERKKFRQGSLIFINSRRLDVTVEVEGERFPSLAELRRD